MKTGKRVAILQSNYIPWKGYFDLINQVDEFICWIRCNIPAAIGAIVTRSSRRTVCCG
ncbi:MAG: WbqC family protein [Caldilineaceae bacterium]